MWWCLYIFIIIYILLYESAKNDFAVCMCASLIGKSTEANYFWF